MSKKKKIKIVKIKNIKKCKLAKLFFTVDSNIKDLYWGSLTL